MPAFLKTLIPQEAKEKVSSDKSKMGSPGLLKRNAKGV